MEKIIRGTVAAMLIVAGLLTTPIAHAEVKIYTGGGEYIMSDYETFDVAQQRAKQRAERDACEQAGVYVESRTEVRDAQVTADEVVTMTNGILKVVDVNYHRENSDNNTTLIRATVVVNIDSDDVLKWLSRDADERATLIAQMEALRKANAEQERQIAELQSRLDNVKTAQDKEQITQAFAAEDKIFLSNQKVDEAWKLYGQGDYGGAIKLLEQAVELNPNNDSAHNNRGLAYVRLGQYENAFADFNRAVALNPNNVDAYNNRGCTCLVVKRYDLAVEDFNRALQLNPNYANAYIGRGVAYMNGYGHYEQAIADYDRAIALNPNNAGAYHNRGLAYRAMGEFFSAQADFTRARHLGWNG